MVERSHAFESSQGALETMKRLEGILASAMDAIITINDQQTIVVFNPAAERLFGLAAADALGQSISRLVPDRYRAVHASHIRRFIETGGTDRQMGSLGAISGLRANGEEFPIEASISQTSIGEERFATVIVRDITERKAAEEAIVEGRRRMEAIVESVMDALITVDEERNIVVFNPAAEQMFGITAAEAMGASLDRFIPERFRAGHGDHIERFKRMGATNRRMGALGAVSAVRANGEEFPVEASISHVQVGAARLATVILRDITERRASEEARDLLAREVDHRAKNVLAVVQAVVSLTRASNTEGFVEAVSGRIAALGRAHSLLAQSRWQGGDLAKIVRDEVQAYVRGHEVEIAGPKIDLKPSAVQPLGLLVHELATNATKYGALSVDGGRVLARWSLVDGGGLEFLWAERGGPPTRQPREGGFGSTLIQEVVTRQLRGALDIAWLAEGMRLTATLPSESFRAELATIGTGPAELKPGRGAGASGRGRLLVVEDEALIAMALARDLSRLGWEIAGSAATIEEARRFLESERFDAAVLDVNLAGQLVYPLAQALLDRGIPFVFCSGYEQLEAHSPYEQCPRVRKPVDIRQLDSELLRVGRAA